MYTNLTQDIILLNCTFKHRIIETGVDSIFLLTLINSANAMSVSFIIK